MNKCYNVGEGDCPMILQKTTEDMGMGIKSKKKLPRAG